MESVKTFYDQFASKFHLVFDDWDKVISEQSQTISTLIQKITPKTEISLWDCTCGVGTQILWLAQLGYSMTGTDMSSFSIQRAKQEAKKRGLEIFFESHDIRVPYNTPNYFDGVISFDNSLPHIIDIWELKTSLQNIFSRLKQGGFFIGSIRDYDKILENRESFTLPSQVGNNIFFQMWEWEDTDIYSMSSFLLEQQTKGYEVFTQKTKYRAYTRQVFSELFSEVWFSSIRWIFPEESGYHQPILVAFKK